MLNNLGLFSGLRQSPMLARPINLGPNELAILAAVACLWIMSERDAVAQVSLRIATYNASLYGKSAGEISRRLADGKDRQAEQIATIIQTVRPDVLLLNEVDYDREGATAQLLADKFFAKAQPRREAIDYGHVFAVPSNTGVDSGLDLDHNGQTGQANDAWGYGKYPGQYSMAIFSRYPIHRASIRTFQRYRWKELPGALRPIDPNSQQSFYDDATWNVLRLSSKNHVDVPLSVAGRTIHLLASHPTPPVFDGPEDRNGCRNHDEIRFWIDYLAGPNATHLVDDQGRMGGLPEDALFVIAGDLNSDPVDGDSRPKAIQSLLEHRRLHDVKPESRAAIDRSEPRREDGYDATDTADFGSRGRLRIDYVLPSRALMVKDSGVYWPVPTDPDHASIKASDHRMVWVEAEIP